MTRNTRFSEAFWGTDFCGSQGFEVLSKRLKEGRQMCKDFEDFLRNRAKLEEEYSKSLLKLSKSPVGSYEIGTMKNSWDTLKYQTERIAFEHQEVSNSLFEAAKNLSEFAEMQKNQRKQEEDKAKVCIKRKLDFYKKVSDSKKAYESKCRELEVIEGNIFSAKQSGMSVMPPKEWEKLYCKQTRTRQDLEKADLLYRGCIDSLEQSRQQWEKDMTHVYNIFQQLEERRFEFLRNEMWVYVNFISQTNVDDDEHHEEVRKSLESCDCKEDIIQFINEKKTGLERPLPITYEPAGGSAAEGSMKNKLHSLVNRTLPLPEAKSMPRPIITHRMGSMERDGACAQDAGSSKSTQRIH